MSQVATLSINITGNAAGLSSALSQAQSQLKSFGSSLRGMGTKLTAAVSLPIAGVGAAAIKAAAEQEQLEIAFTTMLGSATKAKDLIGDLQDFAKATPFGMDQVVPAGKQLLAFGVEAENIQETLRRLGDLSAGVGANIGDMAYLFGTAKAQGRLFMADVNQFSNRGIPIIEALAATMGVATTDVRKLVEEGKVGFPEMQAAIEHLTDEGSKFGGLMEAQSASLAGMWAALQDSIGMSLATIGRAIVEAFDLKPKVAGALEWVEKFAEGLVNLSKTRPELFKLGIGIAVAAAAVGPLLIGLGAMAAALSAALPAIAAVGGALALLVSPVALAVAAVGALAVAFWKFDVGGIPSAITETAGAVWNYIQAVRDAGPFSLAAAGAMAQLPEPLQNVARWGMEAASVFARVQASGVSFKSVIGELVATFTGFGVSTYDTYDNLSNLTIALTGSVPAADALTDSLAAIFERTARLPKLLQDIGSAVSWMSTGQAENIDWWGDITMRLETLAGMNKGSLDWLRSGLYDAGIAAGQLLTPLREIGALTAQLVSGEIGFGEFASSAGKQLDTVAQTVRGWASSMDWGALLQGAGNAAQQIQTTITGWFEGIDFAAAFSNVQAGWDTVTSAVNGWRDQLLTTATSAINSVDWTQASLDFTSLVTRASDALANLDFSKLDFTGLVGGKLLGWWSMGITGMQWVADSTQFDGLKTAVSSAIVQIQWSDMLVSLSELPEAAITALSNFKAAVYNSLTAQIASIDWSQWSVDFGNMLSAIGTSISNIDWTEIGTNIGESLRLLFVGTDESQSAFAGLVEAVKQAFIDIEWMEVLGGLGEMTASLGEAIAQLVVGAINGLFGTDIQQGTITPPQWVNDLTNWLAGVTTAPPWVATLAAWLNGVKNSPVAFVTLLRNWWDAVTTGAVAWVDTLQQWWSNMTTPPGWVTDITAWLSDLQGWKWPSMATPEWVTTLQGLWNRFSGWNPLSFGNNQLGTAYWQGGPTWVGEGGPELVYLPRGAQVIPNREAMRRVTAAEGPIHVTVNASVQSDLDVYALALKVKEVLKRGY